MLLANEVPDHDVLGPLAVLGLERGQERVDEGADVDQEAQRGGDEEQADMATINFPD